MVDETMRDYILIRNCSDGARPEYARNKKILQHPTLLEFNGMYARRSRVTPSIQLHLIQVMKIPKGISRPDYVTAPMNSPDLLLGIRNLSHQPTAKPKRHTTIQAKL